MSDLSSVLFYRTRFSVSCSSEDVELLWAIVLHVRFWITKKYNRGKTIISEELHDWTDIKFGSRLFSTDDANSVYIESDYFSPADSEEYWACRITEKRDPDPGFAPREWTTEIGFEQRQHGEAQFSCTVSYSDRAGFVGPYLDPTPPSVPNLIRNMMNDIKLHAFLGFDDITNLPQELQVGDWPVFYERIVSADRQLPYVYISPCIEVDKENKTINLVDPEHLAKLLFGNAIVYYSKDLGFSDESRYLSSEYSCFGGALRVYQPGVNEAYKHRYLNASYIAELGAENVCKFLRRAFCQNTNFYDAPFFRLDLLRRKKADFLRKKRLAELHEAHREKINEVEQITLDLVGEEEEKRLLAEARIEELEDEVDDLNRTIYSLQSQVDFYKDSAAEIIALRKASDSRFATKKLPETAIEVLEYFENTFSDRLLIAPEAKRSAKYCTIPANELWESLFALATKMNELYKSGNGDIFSEFRNKTGIKAKRGEGAKTRDDKVLMRQFKIVVNGEEIDIEAHITFPNYRQSIHFGYSDKQKLIVIGHCGEHLKIYSTKKVH